MSLVEQLEQNPLDLSIGTSLCVKSLRGDGVDLVDEDDGRRVLLGQAEHVPEKNVTLSMNPPIRALKSKTSYLTILGPSPRYFWTNSEPTTRMKDAVVW